MVPKLELSRVHTLCAALSLHTVVHLSAHCSMGVLVDDLYLHIILGCAHEQKAHWVRLMGVANKNAVFTMLVDLTKQFKAQ